MITFLFMLLAAQCIWMGSERLLDAIEVHKYAVNTTLEIAEKHDAQMTKGDLLLLGFMPEIFNIYSWSVLWFSLGLLNTVWAVKF